MVAQISPALWTSELSLLLGADGTLGSGSPLEMCLKVSAFFEKSTL